MQDEMIRGRIVCGINDSKTRSVQFSKPNLILKRAIEICELQESAESSSMRRQTEAIVQAQDFDPRQSQERQF